MIEEEKSFKEETGKFEKIKQSNQKILEFKNIVMTETKKIIIKEKLIKLNK